MERNRKLNHLLLVPWGLGAVCPPSHNKTGVARRVELLTHLMYQVSTGEKMGGLRWSQMKHGWIQVSRKRKMRLMVTCHSSRTLVLLLDSMAEISGASLLMQDSLRGR